VAELTGFSTESHPSERIAVFQLGACQSSRVFPGSFRLPDFAKSTVLERKATPTDSADELLMATMPGKAPLRPCPCRRFLFSRH
jgi:hypothetical protein